MVPKPRLPPRLLDPVPHRPIGHQIVITQRIATERRHVLEVEPSQYGLSFVRVPLSIDDRVDHDAFGDGAEEVGGEEGVGFVEVKVRREGSGSGRRRRRKRRRIAAFVDAFGGIVGRGFFFVDGGRSVGHRQGREILVVVVIIAIAIVVVIAHVIVVIVLQRRIRKDRNAIVVDLTTASASAAAVMAAGVAVDGAVGIAADGDVGGIFGHHRDWSKTDCFSILFFSLGR
mmetsp:Transcript_983/g.1942  ORF Transcript_983/g.1942 Transcript_983/m.1942 type:complete len:229 (-) Transcript_983:141-827(-)